MSDVRCVRKDQTTGHTKGLLNDVNLNKEAEVVQTKYELGAYFLRRQVAFF